ncbi:MAG: hypothetical protein RLZZ618_2831 [Pseudomonadota bacterium]|jgi:hypothetical protein
MQSLIVGVIVLGCCVYAVWALLPVPVRGAMARGLLRATWPAGMRGWLERTAAGPSGCGCNGCDRSAAVPRSPEPSVQPITIHRAPRR